VATVVFDHGLGTAWLPTAVVVVRTLVMIMAAVVVRTTGEITAVVCRSRRRWWFSGRWRWSGPRGDHGGVALVSAAAVVI
jgi:hypothetical protein